MKTINKRMALLITALIITVTSFGQTKWTTDKNHAQLHFSVMHFGITHIEGIFKTFEVGLISEKKDFTDAKIEMTADVKSINTQVEMRDDDLKSNNWFDAEKFPALIFKSKSFSKVKGNNYKLSGNITMHGITKPISFNVVFNGWAVTMSKKQTAGFTVTGKIKRRDFNIGDTPVKSGVGDVIDVWANVEIGKN
jgi:polyisoprenoid-binding protein YceI